MELWKCLPKFFPISLETSEKLKWTYPGKSVKIKLIHSIFNSFTPKFLKRTLLSLNLDMSIRANRGSCLKLKKKKKTTTTKKKQTRMANSVDSNETSHLEPSHLNLHCLNRCLFWSAGLTELNDCLYITAVFRVVQWQTVQIQVRRHSLRRHDMGLHCLLKSTSWNLDINRLTNATAKSGRRWK